MVLYFYFLYFVGRINNYRMWWRRPRGVGTAVVRPVANVSGVRMADIMNRPMPPVPLPRSEPGIEGNLYCLWV